MIRFNNPASVAIIVALLLALVFLCSCAEKKSSQDSSVNQVIETIMSRHSIRQYKPQAVGRDTMQMILQCGIHAPNAMNRQSWELATPTYNADVFPFMRTFIEGLTEVYKKENPEMAKANDFRNMFRNAPTVVFVAKDTSSVMSEIDCGLLGENMMLAAWSMGIGSCCMGGPVRFIKTHPEAQPYLNKLGFGKGYELLYCIGFGYPDESPEAKPRDSSKVKFVE